MFAKKLGSVLIDTMTKMMDLVETQVTGEIPISGVQMLMLGICAEYLDKLARLGLEE
jgi:hypothetical protein